MAWIAPIVGAATWAADKATADNPLPGDAARAEQLRYEEQQRRIAPNTRAVDEGAFAPIFGTPASTLEGRSSDAQGMGSRNLASGLNTQGMAIRDLQDVRAGIANTSTAGVSNAAQLQGQTAGMLGREYVGGTDPSAAQAQLQAGTDAALRAQLAAARSGGNPAAAYQAQLAGAQTLQTAANQAAVLRAQERQAARGDLLQAEGANTAAQGRVLDAQLGRQSALAGVAGQSAGIGASVASMGQQQVLRADSLTGQAAGLREQDRQSRIALDAAKSQENAGARNFVLGLGSQGIQQQSVNIQAGDQADRRQGVADAKTAGMLQGVAGGVQQIYDSEKDDGKVNSDTRSKRQIRELKAENAMLKGAQGDADVREYLGTIEDTDEDVAAENAFLARYDSGPERPAYDAQQTSMGLYDPWGAGAPPARPAAQPEEYAGTFAPLGGPWATSDERAKDVHAMYDKADPIEFSYRPGYGPPGRREGITAQSLERTPLGRSMVRTNPETGMRQVDTPQLTMANAAEIAMLRDEVRSLKGRR